MNNNEMVFAELSDGLDKIEVHFRYDQNRVAAIKGINGRKWNPDVRVWTVPMDLMAARRLRETFGEDLKLGKALKAWAKQQVVEERNLRQLNAADDAELKHTPQRILDVIAGRPIDLPGIPVGHPLRSVRPERPYQRADISMMAMKSSINANDVGTGKTLECIGAIYEAQLLPKPIIVVAPRRALTNVWETEFRRLAPDYEVLTSESPAKRKNLMAEFAADPSGKVLGVIASDIRIQKYDPSKLNGINHDLHARKDYKGNHYRFRHEEQKALYDIAYGAIIVDEFHSVGLPNRNSLFSLSVAMLEAERRWPMSGTPIGGKPRRLWPILNFIDPKTYTSEWRWIDTWLSITEDEIYVKGGSKRTIKNVGGIQEGLEQEFFEHHRMHMVRRLKYDALPGLPRAVEILIETPMDSDQAKEYRKMEEDHELILSDGERVSGAIVIAQYTRMRQMANSRIVKDKTSKKDTKFIASDAGNKIDALLQALDENGIRRDDWEPGARAYIGVLDKSYLTHVIEALWDAGIDADRLDGDTKESTPLLDKFSSDRPRPYVIVMTIQTGGTALNMERAGSAHALDDAWDPDVMHQFFGRGDRGARMTPLKCYTYRTPETVQEYIANVAGDKKITNRNILQIAREIKTK